MASAKTSPPAGYPNGGAPKAEKEVKSSGNENKNVVENGEDAEKGINVYFMSGNSCGKSGSNGYGRPQQYQHQKYSSGYDSGAFGAAPPGHRPMEMADSNYSSYSQNMEGEYPGHMGMGKKVGYQGHNQGVEYGSSDEEEEAVMVIKNEEAVMVIKKWLWQGMEEPGRGREILTRGLWVSEGRWRRSPL